MKVQGDAVATGGDSFDAGAIPATAGIVEPAGDKALGRTWKRLAHIERLGPDWNSYGAEAPSTRAITDARRLIVTVTGLVGAAALAQSAPYTVAPLVNGGVQVEWRGAGGSVEIEIGPHGELGYFVERATGATPETDEGDDASLSEILTLIRGVVAPSTS